MTRALKYPKANTTAQWFEDKFPRATMNPVSKLLLHTTETGKGWPGYAGGATAPTLTYNPWLPDGQRWRQHCYLDRSARSLRDPSNTVVRENQDGVIQIEICCYCDPKLAAQYGYFVGDLPDHAYEDLGEFLAYCDTHCAVPLIRAGEWDLLPPSDSIRMSGPEYDKFEGLLGHQHASGNTHGDPGMTNAQVDRIIAAAKRHITPSTPSLPEDHVNATDIAAIADAVYAKIEPRLKAYTADLKKYEVQTDGPDAVRAGQAAEAAILTPANIDLIATAVAAKLTPKG